MADLAADTRQGGGRMTAHELTHTIRNDMPEMCIRDRQCADQAAQEQRGIHLLADEGQSNGDHRGEHGPTGGHKAGTVVAHLSDDQSDNQDRQRNKIRQPPGQNRLRPDCRQRDLLQSPPGLAGRH